jgi:hypothetical protein
MNLYLLKALTAALRSGDYKQVKSYFYSDDGGNCVMGVVNCILSNNIKYSGSSNDFKDLKRRLNLEGFIKISGVYRGLYDFTLLGKQLIALNDSGHTFQQIADWIDSYIKEKISKSKVKAFSKTKTLKCSK